MKKIVIFIALLTTLISCKKDYICRCYQYYDGNNPPPWLVGEQQSFEEKIHDRKKNATTQCKSQEFTHKPISPSYGGGTYSQDCWIK